jgi:hypothetical protein
VNVQTGSSTAAPPPRQRTVWAFVAVPLLAGALTALLLTLGSSGDVPGRWDPTVAETFAAFTAAMRDGDLSGMLARVTPELYDTIEEQFAVSDDWDSLVRLLEDGVLTAPGGLGDPPGQPGQTAALFARLADVRLTLGAVAVAPNGLTASAQVTLSTRLYGEAQADEGVYTFEKHGGQWLISRLG